MREDQTDLGWEAVAAQLERGLFVRRESWPRGQWMRSDGEHLKILDARGRSSAATLTWPDLKARDWRSSASPDVDTDYSKEEAIRSADLGHDVYIRFPSLTDRGSLRFGSGEPGWEYEQVNVAIRRSEEF